MICTCEPEHGVADANCPAHANRCRVCHEPACACHPTTGPADTSLTTDEQIEALDGRLRDLLGDLYSPELAAPYLVAAREIIES